MTERVGILGGTFDPPHIGHLALAVQARVQLRLDRVLLVVANDPWQKRDGRRISPAGVRLAMVEAAVEGRPGLEASDIEIVRGGESYTTDTASELTQSDRELYLIIGADLVGQLRSWERCDELVPLVTLAVARRGGTPETDVAAPWRWVALRLPRLELSSTELRAMAAQGLPLEFLVPDGAISVMLAHDLYR